MAGYEPSRTQYNDVSTGAPPVEGLWDNFGQPLINLNSYVTCDDNTPVATAVLEAYGLEYEPFGFAYGTLKDMDIKRMDAMTAIRYSLMEESFAGSYDRFIEMITTAEGKVKFVEVGGDTSNIDDVYYSIQTGQYVDRPRGVMVTGGKPVPEMLPMTWSPIWVAEGSEGAPIYHCADMFNNCHDQEFKSQATIVFNDPHLESAYEDGIDNLYEITTENPWDEILGYVVQVRPGVGADEKTTVQYNSEAEIPILIAQAEEGVCPIGQLQDMPQYVEGSADASCWAGSFGEQVSYGDGVPVEIPSRFRYENIRGNLKDKFINISNVYIVGEEIDQLYARPIDDTAALQDMTENNATIWVTQHSRRLTTVKLEEGRHYAVAVEEGSDPIQISIVFAQETRPHDKIQYGNGQGGGVKYKLNPFSMTASADSEGEELQATILPWQKTKGIFVQQIWVTARVETPSITVKDLTGPNLTALEIAETLQYYVAPMVMRSPPAPIGYKGGFSGPIDLIPTRRDNDPTTVQNFEDTDLERAFDDMQGSGMTITFSFLNGGGGSDADAAYAAAAQETQQAAETIYNMINDDVTETVYTCGPEGTLPELGSRGPAGGIINSIRHSYSDQGSYTISVTEGPQVLGNLVQVDGGPTEKMAEEFGAKGVVTQALGDNIHFKVRLDGFGERWAVNTSHNVIRERDIVQCTVHNNPVEA
jgi:hypothetical protein